MTCTSAPFDHPTADSLGELFLGVAGRGAIGLLGASWRVPASRHFSDALLTELIRPGATVGEAILRAKQREPNKALVEPYNLLGDPALTLALPISALEPDALRSTERTVSTLVAEVKLR